MQLTWFDLDVCSEHTEPSDNSSELVAAWLLGASVIHLSAKGDEPAFCGSTPPDGDEWVMSGHYSLRESFRANCQQCLQARRELEKAHNTEMLPKFNIGCHFCSGQLQTSDGIKWVCSRSERHTGSWHGELFCWSDGMSATFGKADYFDLADMPHAKVKAPKNKPGCHFCESDMRPVGERGWVCSGSMHHNLWIQKDLVVWSSKLRDEQSFMSSDWPEWIMVV